jgi:spore maturation protein CgeB
VKIALAGDWHSNVHERPMAQALERLGHTVLPFAWHRYLTSRGAGQVPGIGRPTLLRRAQNKYLLGPVIGRINADLLELVAREQPDILFVYRGTHVTADTLRRIRHRSPRTLLVGYNNDDAFAPGQPRWPWRHFLGSIPEYDRVLAYRPHNIDDFAAAGARSTGILLPWFVPDVHRPVVLTPQERETYGCDVVFIGHYEQDGRLSLIESLVRANINVRLFGPGRGYRGHDWDGPLRGSPTLRHLAPVREVWGDDYCKALCGSKIALCFLSRRNRDAYTRRCFEIPATRTLMLSEYSPELAGIYREGESADFFRTATELVHKAGHYLQNVSDLQSVARNGYERAFADGHDVDSRMRQMLDGLASDRRDHGAA